MRINKKVFFILAGFFLLKPVYPVFSETICLKSGRKIEAAIIEKTDDAIKVDIDGDVITYFLDEIENIVAGVESVKSEDSGSDKKEFLLIEEDIEFYEVIVHIRNKEYTKASDILKTIIDKDTDKVNINAYACMSIVYYYSGRINEAITLLKEGMDKSPLSYEEDYIEPWVILGLLYSVEGRREEAGHAFQEAKKTLEYEDEENIFMMFFIESLLETILSKR